VPPVSNADLDSRKRPCRNRYADSDVYYFIQEISEGVLEELATILNYAARNVQIFIYLLRACLDSRNMTNKGPLQRHSISVMATLFGFGCSITIFYSE
jgi:hypothetical protein